MLGARRRLPVLRKMCTSTILCTQLWGKLWAAGEEFHGPSGRHKSTGTIDTMSEDHREIVGVPRQRLRGRHPG
jgi:hypothetical protein